MKTFLTKLFVQPYRRRVEPTKTVAIVVPVSDRDGFLPEERISLRHLTHHLGHYEKFLIAPPMRDYDLEGFEVRRFPRKFFGSVAAHNHLLYTPLFFRAFEGYEYVFFYHLDSLVFSDQLSAWCQRGIDYIGPPWLQCEDTPWVTKPRVGNGGFTLLRVEAALKVVYNRYLAHPGTYWLDMFCRNHRALGSAISVMKKLKPRLQNSKLINTPLEELERWENPGPSSRNVDMFWGDKAIKYLPEFKVASFEEGLEFAFEAAPRKCFELNGRRMPFGCHAWARYDRNFWEPHLLKDAAVEQLA
jgi:hypothetical protein